RLGTLPAATGNVEAALTRTEAQLAALPPSATAETRQRLQRETAVLKARSGGMAEAQEELWALLAGDRGGGRARDPTALVQQDGKPDEAVAVFEKAALANPPEYALLAAARAYRDLHRAMAMRSAWRVRGWSDIPRRRHGRCCCRWC